MTEAETRKFVCAGCGHEYSTTTTPEEKEAEFIQIYGYPSCESEDDLVSTCDKCFALVRAYLGR